MRQLNPYELTDAEWEELRERYDLAPDTPIGDIPEFADFFREQALALAKVVTRGVKQMASSFALSAIVPDVEPLTFRDDRFGGDGTVYPVRRKEDFGAVDLASLQRIQSGYVLANKQMRTGKTQEALENGARDLERHLHDLFSLLIPDMPAERIQAIPMQVKVQFLQWWQAENKEKATAEGEAKAPQTQPRVPRGKRSLTSSPVTD
jgi:hypothetical protein